MASPDGGPGAAGDGFLRILGNGGSGAGGNLVAFNSLQWAGDYLGAGVAEIRADLRNLGASDLEVRLLLEGPGGGFLTVSSVALAGGSDWRAAVFPLGPGDLAGGADLAATLAGVTKLRILHAPTPDGAAPVLGELGVDNLTAAPATAPIPEPGSALLLAVGLVAFGCSYASPSASSCTGSGSSPG